jgi:hypothetical protein
VLVGHVIAEVQRHHVVAIKAQHAEQVQHGLALVPIDRGLDLEDHLARRDLQRAGMVHQQGVDDLGDPRPVGRRDEPVMERDRAALALDDHAFDRADILAHARRHPLDQLVEPNAVAVLDAARVGAPDVKAVAARHHEVIETHQLLDDPAVATADHAHGATCRQRTHRLSHAR